MKRALLGALCLFLSGPGLALASNQICAPLNSSSSAKVQWAKLNFSQALARAKKLNCPLLIDLYATWCGPCKRYDKKVFNQHMVSQYIHQYFVPIKRRGTRGEGKKIAKKYNCVTYPCILVIDKKGKEVERITRFLSPNNFISRLQQIRQGQQVLASLLPKLKKRPKDAVLHYRIGRRLAYRGDKRCIKHLTFVSKNPPKRYPWLAPRALYVLGRIYYRNTKRDWASAARVFQEYLKRFPRARKASRVRRMLRGCQRRLQRQRR